MATRNYTTRHNHKAPYEYTSLPQVQKRQKKDTQNTSSQQQQQQQTRVENHVTQTRDVVTQAERVPQQTNNNNQTFNPQIQQEKTQEYSFTEDEILEIEEETNEEINWEHVSYNTRYAILIPVEKIEGENLLNKKRNIEKMIPIGTRYVDTEIKRDNEKTFIKIDFPSNEQLEKMEGYLKINNLDWKRNDYKNKNPLKNRDKEIVVRDIPLGYTSSDIEKHFNIYGDVERVKMGAFGKWQTANIFFKDNEGVQGLATKWSDVIKKDCVRIYPASNYDNVKNARTKYCAKLCNLPRNTTGFDIESFITQQGGKTCFIPRHPESYDRLRYAYINFETKEDLDLVLQDTKEYYFKDQRVFWTEENTKNCNICQAKEHIAKDCPRKGDRARNERRISRLATLYVKTHVEAPNAKNIINKAQRIQGKKSYLEAAKGKTTKQNITTKTNPQTDFETRLSRVENLLEAALFTLQQILKKGEDQEELHKLQTNIKKREETYQQTPTKIPTTIRPPVTKTTLKTPAHPKSQATAQSPLPETLNPIKDNSISIATEVRMAKLERLMEKMMTTINNCEITPKITNNNNLLNMDTDLADNNPNNILS